MKSKTNGQSGGGEAENVPSVTTSLMPGPEGSHGEGDTDISADKKDPKSTETGKGEDLSKEGQADKAENGWEAAEEHKGFSIVDAIKLLFDVEAAELLPLIIKLVLSLLSVFVLPQLDYLNMGLPLVKAV